MQRRAVYPTAFGRKHALAPAPRKRWEAEFGGRKKGRRGGLRERAPAWLLSGRSGAVWVRRAGGREERLVPPGPEHHSPRARGACSQGGRGAARKGGGPGPGAGAAAVSGVERGPETLAGSGRRCHRSSGHEDPVDGAVRVGTTVAWGPGWLRRGRALLPWSGPSLLRPRLEAGQGLWNVLLRSSLPSHRGLLLRLRPGVSRWVAGWARGGAANRATPDVGERAGRWAARSREGVFWLLLVQSGLSLPIPVQSLGFPVLFINISEAPFLDVCGPPLGVNFVIKNSSCIVTWA